MLSGFKLAQVELSPYYLALGSEITLANCLHTPYRGCALRPPAALQVRTYGKEDFLELCGCAISECRAGGTGTSLEGISLARVDRWSLSFGDVYLMPGSSSLVT